MSLIYRLAEGGCFLLNKLPGGGAKGSMSGMFSGKCNEIRLPRSMHKGLTVRQSEFNGCTVHRIRSDNMSGAPKQAILFLPGGGGMARATRLHYDTARRLALMTDAEIFIAHYPLAPKHNVRDALTWLEMFYLTMLQEYKAGDIVFMGDSAGANLVLSLTAGLSARPGGLIVISPACGLENGAKRDIRKEMESHDPILSVAMNDTIAENWCRDVPLDSPDISPEYIDYGDFPPILMFYGSHELFYPLVDDYVTMLREQKVQIRTIVKPMCHDWALCSFFPEGREAIDLMSEWIGELSSSNP